MYKYDENFYRYINQGAKASAQEILPVLLKQLSTGVKSVPVAEKVILLTLVKFRTNMARVKKHLFNWFSTVRGR